MTKEQLLAADVITCWDYGSRGAELGSAPGDDAALVTLATPTLAEIGTNSIHCHRRIAAMLGRALRLVDECGLTGKILTYDGCYNNRPSRGGGAKSTHAWGAAVDFNCDWNGYGDEPAKRGDQGSLREIVGVFQKCGFAWGGHFRRPDGMHFEPYRLLAEGELPTLEAVTPEQAAARKSGYQSRLHAPLSELFTAVPQVLGDDVAREAMAALNLLDEALRKAGCK
ncbi:MAG: M15 family metallopeptidase [Armatimonadetes bacterium]|nr:M15 family metallopeptidase [Armatimonadota bacterium]